jgi:hypothetical protein
MYEQILEQLVHLSFVKLTATWLYSVLNPKYEEQQSKIKSWSYFNQLLVFKHVNEVFVFRIMWATFNIDRFIHYYNHLWSPSNKTREDRKNTEEA